MSKKKIVTSAVALGVAAAIGLGGTFAWQSINQTALNEASDIVNPGGRLHNDQWFVDAKTNNNDIYVENFTDPDHGGEDIYARVRLSEYMEIVMNYGIEGAEVVENVVGKKLDANGNEVTDKATAKDTYTYEYETHYFNKENATDDYWEWELGKKDTDLPYFIPTFNMNKDSLLADLNGDYVDTLGGISNRKNEQYKYEEITSESSKTAYEVYDGDTNKLDEVTRADLLDLIEKGEEADCYKTYKDNIVLANKKHTATKVGVSNGLISMSDWVKLNDGTYSEATHGNYWVYDDSEDGDGWVYWSSPIGAGETTGLLLDSTNLKQVMDDTWYYAIQVTAQFVTADDMGVPGEGEEGVGGTGFYKDGETVSDAAKDFLEEIGVGAEEPEAVTVKLWNGDELNENMGRMFQQSVKSTDTLKIEFSEDGTIPETLTGVYFNADTGSDVEHTYEDGVLTLTDEKVMADGALIYVSAKNAAGHPRLTCIVVNDDGKLSLRNAGDLYDVTFAEVGKGVKLLKDGNAATEEDLADLTFFWRNFDEEDKETPVEGTDYKFENGELTLLNSAYENGYFVIHREGEDEQEWQGYIIVKSADKNDGGNVPGGGTDNPDTEIEPVVSFTINGSTDGITAKPGEKNAYTMTVTDSTAAAFMPGIQVDGETAYGWTLALSATNGDFDVNYKNLGGVNDYTFVSFDGKSLGSYNDFDGRGIKISEIRDIALTITATKDDKTATLDLVVTRPELGTFLLLDGSQEAEAKDFTPGDTMYFGTMFEYLNVQEYPSYDAIYAYLGAEDIIEYYFVESATSTTKITPTGVTIEQNGDNVHIKTTRETDGTLYFRYGIVSRPNSYSVVTLRANHTVEVARTSAERVRYIEGNTPDAFTFTVTVNGKEITDPNCLDVEIYKGGTQFHSGTKLRSMTPTYANGTFSLDMSFLNSNSNILDGENQISFDVTYKSPAGGNAGYAERMTATYVKNAIALSDDVIDEGDENFYNTYKDRIIQVPHDATVTFEINGDTQLFTADSAEEVGTKVGAFDGKVAYTRKMDLLGILERPVYGEPETTGNVTRWPAGYGQISGQTYELEGTLMYFYTDFENHTLRASIGEDVNKTTCLGWYVKVTKGGKDYWTLLHFAEE